ncbi:sigma-70 family RNA polymerase sigma factor [Nocardia seriolae]|uniref:sigma-70 family RNA polymerase sigma factor n=1 Tax=Nocardia seriolae TaxID=37332 RepID=UPI0008FF0C33|nr:sigma-70 family RNA polymerase sigma factor [Nocardia seriolae]OJF82378.1 hypothetical protein NS14008_28545 [Nocardia seriolae]PSK26650.1 RNA polymerase subunit sigma [Nocardia seriolae]QOW33124.1 sigma-70 family RNA polymerase sigma factor [Nocardia seriolae]QUN14631.1 sigma-70 family RNA polymerase sigma factor [Nocardia seriolae]WNJ60679.1 sigma-70 family RNA polymerase sigma factor [Nocardia seriolae]
MTTSSRHAAHSDPHRSRADLDEAVVHACRGDEIAIARVLQLVRAPVLEYCRKRIGTDICSSLSADDVAQEVCVGLLKALPQYRDMGKPFMSFVYGIAKRKVADARRHAVRDMRHSTAALGEHVSSLYPNPEDSVAALDLAVKVNGLLASVPRRSRRILLLRLGFGLSARETAEILGCTPAVVRTAQHRALTKLRGSVENCECRR